MFTVHLSLADSPKCLRHLAQIQLMGWTSDTLGFMKRGMSREINAYSISNWIFQFQEFVKNRIIREL